MDDNYQLTAKLCPDGDSKPCDQHNIKGSWELLEQSTMILELENGMRFITGMRYEF